MKSQIELENQRLQIAELIRPGSATILVGAGISTDPPSSIPIAGPLMDIFCRWIAGGNSKLRQRLNKLRQPSSEKKPYLGPYASLRFELLLDWILFFRPNVLSALRTIQDHGSPNRWHMWLAGAIRAGATVITTNFDTRIENACRHAGVRVEVGIIGNSKPALTDLHHANLLKLHGSFPDKFSKVRCGSPVGTLRQIARWGLGYEQLGEARSLLYDRLSSRPLLICGYSGWDSFDVVPILEDMPCKHPLIWYDWKPSGALQVSSAPSFDPLSDWTPDRTPADLLLAHRARRFPDIPTLRISGPAENFLDALTTALDATLQRDLLIPMLNPADSAQRFEALLSKPAYRLTAQQAGFLVDKLAVAYGNERAVDRQVSRVIPTPRNKAESKVIQQLETGNLKEATKWFLKEIRRSEGKGDRQSFSEDVIWILDQLFWRALHSHQPKTAASLVRKIRHEAKHRRILWAVVLAEYLHGNLLHDLALRSDPKHKQKYVQRAVEHLRQAIRYAPRIPRLDIAVDAARLLLYMESDPGERDRLTAAIKAWISSLPPSETKLLALFDLLRNDARRKHFGELNGLLSTMRAVQRAKPRVPCGKAYVAISRCYVALSGKTSKSFWHALSHLDRMLPGIDSRFRSEITIERDELRTIGGSWFGSEKSISS